MYSSYLTWLDNTSKLRSDLIKAIIDVVIVDAPTTVINQDCSEPEILSMKCCGCWKETKSYFWKLSSMLKGFLFPLGNYTKNYKYFFFFIFLNITNTNISCYSTDINIRASLIADKLFKTGFTEFCGVYFWDSILISTFIWFFSRI